MTTLQKQLLYDGIYIFSPLFNRTYPIHINCKQTCIKNSYKIWFQSQLKLKYIKVKRLRKWKKLNTLKRKYYVC